MSEASLPIPGVPRREWVTILFRLVVGGLFVFMGLAKALHPVEFLKLVREYELVEVPFWLNAIAATLPWFEVFCGVLLLAGVAVRGTALVSLGMLVPFTAVVWNRALAIQAAQSIPFCDVRFDCGCGAGDVWICNKLVENGLLVLLSIWLVAQPGSRFRLRFQRGGALAGEGEVAPR